MTRTLSDLHRVHGVRDVGPLRQTYALLFTLPYSHTPPLTVMQPWMRQGRSSRAAALIKIIWGCFVRKGGARPQPTVRPGSTVQRKIPNDVRLLNSATSTLIRYILQSTPLTLLNTRRPRVTLTKSWVLPWEAVPITPILQSNLRKALGTLLRKSALDPQ